VTLIDTPFSSTVTNEQLLLVTEQLVTDSKSGILS
jgi:hypothetical protein